MKLINMKSIYISAIILITAFAFLSNAPLLLNGTIDLNNLDNYANQTIPNYITKDNTPADNPITDAGATLGRVLFYDVALSSTDTKACASCHLQEFAFSDPAVASVGHNGGTTGRHAMRLSHSRFGTEANFFWDERAASLEAQSTEPIQDHVEMGFSGTNGDPDILDLCDKLEAIDYYNGLFYHVYGDIEVTEERIQDCLSQFIRSIQSFDSKYDIGRAQVNNQNQNFPNFTAAENAGKTLFSLPTGNGGAGCQGCHRAPEFDIDPNSNNNNIIGVIGDPNAVDVTNTRSPSLRDLVNDNGVINGPMMHTGEFSTLLEVIDHYDDIDFVQGVNTNLDNRLRGGPGGNGQTLNLTATEKANLEAFLLTLTSVDIYTNEKWASPFDVNGDLMVLNSALPVNLTEFSVSAVDEVAVLEWATAQEFENDYFQIERSIDQKTWKTIGKANGAGNSSIRVAYEFMDKAPEAGTNYYRLKQVDWDGKHEYSAVQAVEFKGSAFEIKAYPNPFTAEVTLEGSFDIDQQIAVYDVFGKLVQTIAIDEETTLIRLNITENTVGLYLIILKDKRDNVLERLSVLKH